MNNKNKKINSFMTDVTLDLSAMLIRDSIKIAKKNKVKEVIIFRLGGLNKEYVNILKNY